MRSITLARPACQSLARTVITSQPKAENARLYCVARGKIRVTIWAPSSTWMAS